MSGLVFGAEPAVALTRLVTPGGALVIFQRPGRPEEKVVIWVVFLDKLVTLVHGQPGMLDPGGIGIKLGGASLAAWVAVIFIVR